VPKAPFLWAAAQGSDIKANAAAFYINLGAGISTAKTTIAGAQKLGYKFKDIIPIDPAGIPNYNQYANQLKSDGVKFVLSQLEGAHAVPLMRAFYQADYHPLVLMSDQVYDPSYVGSGDQTKAVNGTYLYITIPMFEEANRNPELANYLTWLQRTGGGAPTFAGVWAWAACALFTQLALKLGGQLSRSAVIAGLKNTTNFTANNMVGPQDVGAKHTSPCRIVIQLVDGRWVRKTPYPYTCNGVVDSGVSG